MKFLHWLYFCLLNCVTISFADDLKSYCPDQVNPGLVADFYFYPLKPGSYHENKSWFLAGVNTSAHIGTQPNVTEVSFDIKRPSNSEVLGNVYGFPVTIAHFAVVLTGFFRPAKTTDYVFDLAHCDDGASVQVGSGMGGSCCSEDFNAWVDSDDIVICHWGVPVDGKRTHHLREGLYYPIRIVSYNNGGAGNLGFTISAIDNLDNRSDVNGGELLGPAGGSCPVPIPSTLRSTSMASSSATSSAFSSRLPRSSSTFSGSITAIVPTKAPKSLSSAFSDTHSSVQLSTGSIVSSQSHTSGIIKSDSTSMVLSSINRSSSSKKEVQSKTLGSSEADTSTFSRPPSSTSHPTPKRSKTSSLSSLSLTTKSSVLGSSSSAKDISKSVDHRSSHSANEFPGSKSSGLGESSSMSFSASTSSSVIRSMSSIVASTSSTILQTRSLTSRKTDSSTHKNPYKSQSSSLPFSESKHPTMSSVFNPSRSSNKGFSTLISMNSVSKQPTFDYSSRSRTAATVSLLTLSSRFSSLTVSSKPKDSYTWSSISPKPTDCSLSCVTSNSAPNRHSTKHESSSDNSSENNSGEQHSSTASTSNSSSHVKSKGSYLNPTASNPEKEQSSTVPTRAPEFSHNLPVTSYTSQADSSRSKRRSKYNEASNWKTSLSNSVLTENLFSRTLSLPKPTIQGTSSASVTTRVASYSGEFYESNFGTRHSNGKYSLILPMAVAILVFIL